MPELVYIVAGALSIVSSTYKIYKTSADLVSGVHNAPLHVSRVSDDLQNFYPVLGSLQTALENITLDHSGLIEDIHLFLQKNLQTWIRIFRDITLLVHQYKDFDSDNTKKAVKNSDNSGMFHLQLVNGPSSNGIFKSRRSRHFLPI